MRDVVRLSEIDRTMLGEAGGKGAQLGELTRIDGIQVPDGFCVTSGAFKRTVTALPGIAAAIDRLSLLSSGDAAATDLSAQLRQAIEAVELPADLVAAIASELTRLGEQGMYAVRSSATAEDLPSASFAGQQESYLNISGLDSILAHVKRCWASLFTERAVSYRSASGFAHRGVDMAVVVQAMVPADAAGVLFTADPVTGNRTFAAIEAVRGLGENFVAGQVRADAYTVRDGEVVASTTVVEQPVLTDDQVLRLVRLGRRIEAHAGEPQDIEWCLAGDAFFVVQSRPITTLYPVPSADGDSIRVYASVGHQQMMTDAMKPLGLSVWQLTALRPMAEAGSRLFVDITPQLATSAGRHALLTGLGASEPLISDALSTVMDRNVVPVVGEQDAAAAPVGAAPSEPEPGAVERLIAKGHTAIADLRRDMRQVRGASLFEAILASIDDLKQTVSDPESMQVLMTGLGAANTLNSTLRDWLGETNAADVLAQSVPHNITAQMGLALVDVADVMRQHPDVISVLKRVDRGELDGSLFLEELGLASGGAQALAALDAFLETYGMRCVGEIDITRERWAENPAALVPSLLSTIANAEPGESSRRFERGRRQALAKRDDVLTRLRALPDGDRKVAETRAAIERLRAYTGYREFPKYVMVSHYFEYRKALLGEAERQVRAGLLRAVDDISFLRFEEFHDGVRRQCIDDELIDARREAFARDEKLAPPRLLTSEGEAIHGRHRRNGLPTGALAGLAVSAGTVEGRARVIADIGDADLEPGDILVTAFTDPSWTPVFLGIAGLVTEVGGVMTHGAVIAREYGLPAVVAVENATRLIRDGQRIRVHGTDGFVEILAEPDAGEHAGASID